MSVGIGSLLRPEDRHAVAAQQLGDAADVIGMVMGGEDRGELQLLAREIVEHRPRLAGIDHRGVASRCAASRRSCP